MPHKINISTKEGKSWKLEVEEAKLDEKELDQIVKGEEFSEDLSGYEFQITGASDKSGFILHKDAEGVGLKRLLFKIGFGMHKRPKGDKKKNPRAKKGLRLRKTVRGKVISPTTVQINMKVLKEGSKKLSEIFPDQNKPKDSQEEKKEWFVTTF